MSKSPNCYSDIGSRLFSKEYEEEEFSRLLLGIQDFKDKSKEINTKYIGFKFASQIFKEENQPYIQNMIVQNNLDVRCTAGSLTFSGNDIPIFIELIRKKLNDYISLIEKKDMYETEFMKVFKH